MFRQRANANGGTGECCLRLATFRLGFGGVEPTSLTQPFLSHLSLSLGRRPFIQLPPAFVLSMNCDEISKNDGADNEFLCTGY